MRVRASVRLIPECFRACTSRVTRRTQTYDADAVLAGNRLQQVFQLISHQLAIEIASDLN
jgi:hypothetical protein